jgi:hypothetical protein
LNSIAKRFTLLFIILVSQISVAQVCDVIINVCGNELISSNPDDEDSIPDLDGTCVTINGVRSVWYKIKIESGNELTFVIEPNGAAVDYDFVVYGPNPDCNNVTNDIALRANYSGETLFGGSTGLSTSATEECSGAFGSQYSSPINVQSGEEYLIVVDRYSNTASTFDLIWGTGVVLDCSIVVGDLGPDQEVCEGENIVLDGTSPATTAIGYQWSLNTGAGFTEIVGQTNPIYVINNNVSGTYKVEVTDLDGSTDDDEVEINFYSQPTITPLPNPLYEVFDTDGTEDGYTTFNLRDLFNNILLGSGQTPGTYGVEYYQSQAEADANVNPIPNSGNYTNIPDNPDSTDEIFARVVTNAAPNTCIPATTSFKLLVNINEPPVLSANFRGAYCPLSDIKIAENFTITDSDDTGLDFFTDSNLFRDTQVQMIF